MTPCSAERAQQLEDRIAELESQVSEFAELATIRGVDFDTMLMERDEHARQRDAAVREIASLRERLDSTEAICVRLNRELDDVQANARLDWIERLDAVRRARDTAQLLAFARGIGQAAMCALVEADERPEAEVLRDVHVALGGETPPWWRMNHRRARRCRRENARGPDVAVGPSSGA